MNSRIKYFFSLKILLLLFLTITVSNIYSSTLKEQQLNQSLREQQLNQSLKEQQLNQSPDILIANKTLVISEEVDSEYDYKALESKYKINQDVLKDELKELSERVKYPYKKKIHKPIVMSIKSTKDNNKITTLKNKHFVKVSKKTHIEKCQ